MADAKGAADLRRARAAAQLLADSKKRTPAQIVRHLLAVQAQDFASVPLALRARSRGLKRASLYKALDDGELVISWLNRGTLHLVHRDDFAWLHALTAPTTRKANERRLAQEGVTDPARGVKAIAKALADGPMLRRDIGEAVAFKAAALTHLLLAATLEGLIVRGPIRGKDQTFALVEDHLGKQPEVDREAALRELAKRYFKGHSPGTDDDLAYWAKLPKRDVRFGTNCLSSAYTGGQALQIGEAVLLPKLLPPFDPYIMGWRDRSFAIPVGMEKRVVPGGGMFRAVVLVDGVAAGTWSRAGGRVVVDSEQRIHGLDDEIADVERFLA